MTTFGIQKEGVVYTDRIAAYAVILGEAATVAAVRGPFGRFWLPGGGCMPGESAEQAVAREVLEELGCGVRLVYQVCEAIQFFHALDEGCHYRMRATFFRAELGELLAAGAEHDLHWFSVPQARTAFFHECHGWAVERVMQQSDP